MTCTTNTLTKTQQLANCFEFVDLGDNAFWALTNDAPEEVQDLVRELHDDELPNNWRYYVIATITNALAEGYDLQQAIDDCIDLYNSDLVTWLELLSRESYIQEAQEAGLIEEDANTWTRIQLGQYVAIEQIAHRLAEYCEE